MDDATYAKSTLRSLKSTNTENHFLNSPNSLKANIWRLLCFNSISAFLGFLLISEGWSSINSENILIAGNNYIKKERIIKGIKPLLNSPLLAINPKQIEASLLKDLPIKSISISRRIVPARLFIAIEEREPVAFGERNLNSLIEEGLIDKEGFWIEVEDPQQTIKDLNKSVDLSVEGWMEAYKNLISYILKYQDQLGSPLKRLIFSANGEINIQTKDFFMVYLGSNQSIIEKQLKTLAHLSKNLPKKYIQEPRTIIDLRDPQSPKLQLPQKNDLL